MDFNPSQPYPNVVMAWICLPGLPGHMYNRRILWQIGGMIGKVAKLDFNTDNGVRGRGCSSKRKIDGGQRKERLSVTQSRGKCKTILDELKENCNVTPNVTYGSQSSQRLATENLVEVAVIPTIGVLDSAKHSIVCFKENVTLTNKQDM
ncbi:hypothetical protein Gogos_010584 [Gossypium gossypioides]|uniref:DUF4283 domain-containing protein n=1 Tax=Gossypium gossypioides TaxID=34282 RepID=A0A7J9BLN1_GOSGO|nr:hypothetical protein [Gossypium gossypioides]